MARVAKLTMILAALATILPALPAFVQADTHHGPPHVRRGRGAPPPPHVYRGRVRRGRVVHHVHHVAPPPAAPTRRPRQTIADPRTSLYFGLGPVGNFLVESEDALSKEIEIGGGLEMFFGFRFSRFAAFEFGGMFSFHGTRHPQFETGIMTGLTADIKVFFLPGSRRIEPFIQAGAGLYLFSRETWSDNELTGGGLQLGGGIDIRLNRTVAIGARCLWRGVYMDNSEATYWSGGPFESTFLNMVTLSANVQLHF